MEDAGPGIPHLEQVLSGRYHSTTGLGVGIMGARRLTEGFSIQAVPGHGTTVTLGKPLPPATRARSRLPAAELGRVLAATRTEDALTELEHRNQELLRALAGLAERQAETDRLNAELAETNRGVLALYAELDDRAAELGRASHLKSAFLSGITHELRTPLNSILNMTLILLSRMDGELTPEQELQVTLIQKSATTLADLVADLLDLARIEAGKTEVRLASFAVTDMFGALRGMFRPLLTTDEVGLAFEAPDFEVTLHTDEGKLSQILRNLISNAIKFTERGEIRVSAGDGGGRFHGLRGERQRRRHHARGPGADLRGVRPGGQPAPAASRRARAWACRCRAGWPSFSGAVSRWRAHRGSGRDSSCGCRGFTVGRA